MQQNQYYLAGSFTDTISMALTDEVTYAVPVRLDDGTLDRIGIQVTVGGAGSEVRLGIYENDDGIPGALVLDAGPVDTSTTGAKQATIDQEIAADRYWLTATMDGGTPPEILAGLAPPWSELPQGTSAPSDATWAHSLTETGVSGPLPDPFGTVGIETDFGPQVFFRYAADDVAPPEFVPTVVMASGSGSTQEIYETESWTPVPDTLYVLTFLSKQDGFATLPSAVSGNDLSWTQFVAQVDDTTTMVFGTYYAMGSDPTAGPITFTFAGTEPDWPDALGWVIVEWPGTPTGSNGDNAVGTGNSADASDAQSLEVTTPTFIEPDSGTFGAFVFNDSRTVVPGDGFTLLTEFQLTDVLTLGVEWKDEPDESVDMSVTGTTTNIVGGAIEIKRA